jgi:hippurate hydrolase
MHACGHDGHTAMLLAAAKHLCEAPNFDGTVYLVLPAGRRRRRRRARDDQGRAVREVPDGGVFGAHNWPGMAVGQFALKTARASRAATSSRSRSAARARTPRCRTTASTRCRSACQMVQAFQTIITRNKRPIDAGVISVTMIHTGEATNVVPDSCEIQGTVRTFTLEVLDLIETRMQEIAEHTCAAFDASCEFEFERNYPPTINHAAETAFARSVMAELVGADNVHEFEPTMGAEDFSYFLLEQARLLLPDRQRRRQRTAQAATAWGRACCTTRATTSTTT